MRKMPHSREVLYTVTKDLLFQILYGFLLFGGWKNDLLYTVTKDLLFQPLY
jgi:hypothetical protein